MRAAAWCFALLTACASPATVARAPATAPTPTVGASLIVDGKAPFALHWTRTAAGLFGAQPPVRTIAPPGEYVVTLLLDGQRMQQPIRIIQPDAPR